MNLTAILIIAFCVWVIAWSLRTEATERLYDEVPKVILARAREINGGLIPPEMETALKRWLPRSEDFQLNAEAFPIFHEHNDGPVWCIRIEARGNDTNSKFDALFNRNGEILT